jgi:hypothetical protein
LQTSNAYALQEYFFAKEIAMQPLPVPMSRILIILFYFPHVGWIRLARPGDY